MSRELRVLAVAILCFSSLFAQKLTKEEEAVKAAIMQGATAYSACDYEKWAEIVVQDDRYFGFVVNPDYLEIFNDWKGIEASAKDDFKNSSPYLGPVEITDWKFVISGDMALVRCKMWGTPQVRVLLKEKGKWREVFFCEVGAGAYESKQKLNSVEKLYGEWTYIANSFHTEPEIAMMMLSGNLTIAPVGMTIDLNINWLDQWNVGQNRAKLSLAWDEARQIFKTVVTGKMSTNSAWASSGTTEVRESGLMTKAFAKEGDEKPWLIHELTLTSTDRLVEKETHFDKEGKPTQAYTCEWQRK